jgi:hypothetical protein
VTVRQASHNPVVPRLVLVAGGIVLATLAGLGVWARDRHGAWYLAVLGAYLVVLAGAAIAFCVAVVRRRRRTDGFVLTAGGFAVRPAAPPEPLAVILMCLIGMQLGSTVDVWVSLSSPEPGSLPETVAFASVLTVLLAVVATVVVALVRFAWHGFGVELTPAGIWSRAPFHRRLIPWDALGRGASFAEPGPRRLQLEVAQPERVVQRGWAPWSGTRQRPILPVDREARLLLRAIHWYAERPADRAAIGTTAEHDRLTTELAATLRYPAPAPYGPTPLGTPVLPLSKPRQVAIALRVAYIAVTMALVTATADLLITILLRERLLAAEAAIAADRPPLPPDQDEGTLLFDSDTWAFARGQAVVVLIGTSLVAILAIALARATARGSHGARIGLAVLSGAAAFLALCPCLWTANGLTVERAAGPFLNSWAAVQVLAGFAVAALALVVLLLLLSVSSPSRQDSLTADASR